MKQPVPEIEAWVLTTQQRGELSGLLTDYGRAYTPTNHNELAQSELQAMRWVDALIRQSYARGCADGAGEENEACEAAACHARRGGR